MKNDILVEQTLAGDHQAFNGLITYHYADIYGMILSWVKEPEDAKDLTQDVFISAYLDLPSLKDHKRFYSWLRQIARHKCQNWRRKQIDFVPLHDDLISKEPSIDEVLILRETLAKVMEAIDNLPESEKRLLKEHYLDDLSYDELEASHGVSTKALVMRLVRARRKIRDQLEKTLSAFVAFLHDHTESILTGGTEIVKLSIKTKLIAGGIAIMLATGGTGVLVKHYYLQNIPKESSSESNPKLPMKSVSINKVKSSVKNVNKPLLNNNLPSSKLEKIENREIKGPLTDNMGVNAQKLDNSSVQITTESENTSTEPKDPGLITPAEQVILEAIGAEWRNGNLTHERALQLMELERSILVPKNPERLVIETKTGKYYYMPPGTDRFPDDATEISKKDADSYMEKGIGIMTVNE